VLDVLAQLCIERRLISRRRSGVACVVDAAAAQRGGRAGQRPEAAEQQGAPAPCSALFQPGQLSSSLSQ